MSNQNDISYLTSEDLEMLLLGTVAFWGDGSLNKEELYLLNRGCKKRIENLEITDLSDSSDIELSSKEYIIALFKMIEKVSADTKIYEDTELHKDFIKKKGKDYQPDNQIKFFSFLINELNASYEDDLNPEIDVSEIAKVEKEKEKEKEEQGAEIRFTKLYNEMKKIVDIDKETDKEKDMMQLLDLYKKNESSGCGCMLVIIAAAAAAVWYFW